MIEVDSLEVELLKIGSVAVVVIIELGKGDDTCVGTDVEETDAFGISGDSTVFVCEGISFCALL